MERFARTCLTGTIPSLIEPYSLATSSKKVAHASLGPSYVSGSVLKENGISNYPEILRRYVLVPHMRTACKNKTIQYGKPIAKHGYFQRNVADIASNVYALESILPLVETTADGSTLELVVANTGKRLMDRVFRQLYGIQECEEAHRNILAIHNDTTELYSSIEATVVQPSAVPSAKDIIPIDVIPNVHELFQTESKLLVDTLKDLLKDKKTVTHVQSAVHIQKLWSCFVVLWRTSEALLKKQENAYHESLLTVRYCNQVRHEIREDTLQTEEFVNYKKMVQRYDTEDILSLNMNLLRFQTMCDQSAQQ